MKYSKPLNTEDALEYILSGDVEIMIRSPKTNKMFNYRIRKNKKIVEWYNQSYAVLLDDRYIGVMYRDNRVNQYVLITDKNSGLHSTSTPVIALLYVVNRLDTGSSMGAIVYKFEEEAGE